MKPVAKWQFLFMAACIAPICVIWAIMDLKNAFPFGVFVLVALPIVALHHRWTRKRDASWTPVKVSYGLSAFTLGLMAFELWQAYASPELKESFYGVVYLWIFAAFIFLTLLLQALSFFFSTTHRR